MTQATALFHEPELDWGHRLKLWDTGRSIRVPQSVFPLLKERGLLIGNKPILSPLAAQEINDRTLDPIMLELRMVLGPDLSGPATVVCRCAKCQKRDSQLDDSRLSTERTTQIVAEAKARRKSA